MLKQLRNNRLFKNITWIFIGTVLHSLLAFLVNLYVSRKLSLDTKGYIDYATSWITFFTGIAGLGYASTITREFSEDKDRAGDYLCSCIGVQILVSILCIFLLQVIVRLLNPGEPLLYTITLCQSTTILFSSFILLVYWFRYQNKANTSALLRFISFGAAGIFRILSLVLFDSIIAYVCWTAAESVIYALLLTTFFCRYYKGTYRFSFKTAWHVLQGSYPFILATILSTLYAQADRIMLKSMVGSSAVALYSASVTLASALSMIPSSLVEGFRPEIMDQKTKDESLYRRRFRQLYAVIFWSSVCYCTMITLFPQFVISLLYGQKYIDASSSLALVVWYSTFSYFGSVNNMYMVAEKKAHWVQITTTVGALSNIALNAVLIPKLGIVGAALASLLTQFVANFVMMWLVPGLRPGFQLMIEGITLRKIFKKEK